MTLTLDEDHIYRLDGKIIDGLTATIREAGLGRNADPWYMERGTAIHKATELWDKGTLDEGTVHPGIQGYLESWKRFRKDQSYTPIEIEYRTYHPELMVGMTIDRILLLDIKGGVPEAWHVLQIALHWDTLSAHGMGSMIKIPMDVYLDPDGGPPKVRLYTQAEMREAFKVYCSMLHFLRWKKSKGVK